MPTPARATKTRPPSNNANCDMIRRTQKTAPAGALTPNRSLTPVKEGLMDMIASNDRRPLTIGDDIRENHNGDTAAWLATLLGLPVEHVQEKLDTARPAEVAA